jgi:hypothetical protein
LCAERRLLAIAGHTACFDPLVRLAPRAHTGFADELIEPQRVPYGRPLKKAPICLAKALGSASNGSPA